jgi:hypothetical protein
VVERGHGLDADPWVEVQDTDDPDAWELALERACGAILAARGPVGLSLLGRRHGPGDGAAFRRRLLALLADAPVRGRR